MLKKKKSSPSSVPTTYGSGPKATRDPDASRCQSLFEGLIEAQRWALDKAAKKKAARAAKAETDSLVAEAQESLQRATAKL